MTPSMNVAAVRQAIPTCGLSPEIMASSALRAAIAVTTKAAVSTVLFLYTNHVELMAMTGETSPGRTKRTMRHRFTSSVQMRNIGNMLGSQASTVVNYVGTWSLSGECIGPKMPKVTQMNWSTNVPNAAVGISSELLA
eukprot:914884-Ditylum_brightwellii.AAC.2